MSETTSAAEPMTTSPVSIPLSLFVFALLYGGMTVLAGFLAVKQVQLWPTNLGVEAGIFAFLVLVVLSSAITQIHGKQMANKLVWWGFLPLGASIVLIFFVLALPADPAMWPEGLEAFQLIHATTPRIMAAGPAAYLVSLLLNVWIFDRLRGTGEASTSSLMARGAVASALSQALDSVIFVTLAFAGERDITNLLIGQVIAKVALSLVLVPFLITFGVKAAQWLDRRGTPG
ncbi:queuosine precursor transporter [Erythrobacter sp. JK5]|nr:queuosine precursor transporter [Erythrobacter sp. JK5]QUL39436.1 queuosine precursor transporter [Erythrobacter sp. JK5]